MGNKLSDQLKGFYFNETGLTVHLVSASNISVSVICTLYYIVYDETFSYRDGVHAL